MELNEKERLILYNQYEILKAVDPKYGDMYRKFQTILLRGYEAEYYQLFENDETFTEEKSNEVYDILDMFAMLYRSYLQLNDKGNIKELDCMFGGFDGNEEAEYCQYARWLIEEDNRFSEFANVNMNSHCNRLPYYRTMLKRYNDILNKNNVDKYQHIFTCDEINAIIK